jgi:transcriptional regulator with PAS, ATPase and Fis domain
MAAGAALANNRKPANVRLVGVSRHVVALREEIERVARSDAKILITGESGVGKEVVAACIHANSARSRTNFIAVNCGGMPETLLESELFGHVRGSFTGAYRDKPGKLELAHEGTVFLDEVGEMTLRMQGLLLRFLETGELQKVGADGAGRVVNVRVIAATNRNLRDLIAQGQFREDLFYRLNVIHLELAPLRERAEDIPVLAEYFLQHFGRDGNCVVKGINADAMNILRRYSWPGNVRQLVNVLERLTITCREAMVTPDDLPPEVRVQEGVAFRPKSERRRTIADDLYKRLTEDRESFWSCVYTLYMDREITRGTLREVIRKGLHDARGNYRIVARMFNLEPREYKRFLNFLRKHDCQLPFKEFRQ